MQMSMDPLKETNNLEFNRQLVHSIHEYIYR